MRWTQAELDAYERRRKADPKAKLPAVDSVAPPAEPKRSIAPEPMAKAERENPVQVRCLVSITSFRVRPTDDDNIYHKDAIDALKESGAIFDDSPQWVKIERQQVKVDHQYQERTEIELTATDFEAKEGA